MVIFEGTLHIGVLRWITAGPLIASPKGAFAEARAVMEHSALLVVPESAKSRKPFLSPAATATGCDDSLLSARSKDDQLALPRAKPGIDAENSTYSVQLS